MINTRTVAFAFSWLLLCGLSLSARDLSQYREFHLDSDLSALAAQAGMKPAEAKVVHQRPAEIQLLSWRATPGDSVNSIAFRFFNGTLYSMVVDYDRENTAGLTAKDMIEAISATYGAAVDPSEEMIAPSIYGNDETVKVLARWEDSEWSYNLVRFKYETSFSLVAVSKRLHDEARAAIDESVRLDRQEAPQRALESRLKEEQNEQKQQEKSRLENKPGFRP